MRRIEQILLILLVGSIPIQLGYHFWPSWAFVSGIRVDYLSPIFYFSDIFLIPLAFLFLIRNASGKRSLKGLSLLLLLFVVPFIAFFNIVHFESFAYSLVRLVGYVIFGCSVAQNIDSSLLKRVAKLIVVISLFVIILEIAQFVAQSSLQGLFYFLGERNFSLSTPGIARFSLDGSLILRPYATFPHPNVLAFYLFIAFLFTRWLIALSKRTSYIFLYRCTYVIILCGIFLTFSRLLVFCGALLLFLDLIKKRIGLALFIAVAGIFMFFFSDRFVPAVLTNDFVDRLTHALGVARYLGQKVFSGVGLNQYFYYQIEAEREISPYFLQPPHNIAVLVLIQTGMAGILLLSWGIIKTARKVLSEPHSEERELKILLVITILFASLFDHYFITLHQGALLTALSFGLFWGRKS